MDDGELREVGFLIRDLQRDTRAAAAALRMLLAVEKTNGMVQNSDTVIRRAGVALSSLIANAQILKLGFVERGPDGSE